MLISNPNKVDTTATSWEAATSVIPKEQLPDFDVQLPILGNTSQVGRFWIRQLTPAVYTGTAQTGSYEQTAYLHVQHSKPIPVNPLV